jgi:uncharacterized protein (DUF427 family)
MDRPANPSPGFQRNPGKVITLEPYKGTVTVSAGGTVIARSSRAIRLEEPPYPAVFYIPFADIDFGRLEPSAASTHCPYKGDARYWSVPAAGEKGKDALWAYLSPFDEMEAIREHGAFYASKLAVEARPG